MRGEMLREPAGGPRAEQKYLCSLHEYKPDSCCVPSAVLST